MEKNVCKWDSNPCPKKPQARKGVEVSTSSTIRPLRSIAFNRAKAHVKKNDLGFQDVHTNDVDAKMTNDIVLFLHKTTCIATGEKMFCVQNHLH